MKTLLLDFGNTRLKWCLQGTDLLGALFVKVDIESVLNQLHSEIGSVDRIGVACVKGAAFKANLCSVIRKLWGVDPYVSVTRAVELGLVCSYEDPAKMGVDRWLAMLAAYKRFGGGLCIVDSGTAMTIDFVASDGQHAGGYIVPGLHLSVDSLLKGTEEVKFEGLEAWGRATFGKSTQEAVYNGALFAQVSIIEKANSELLKVNPEGSCTLIVTGGNADLISPFLNISHRIEPELVLEGLSLSLG